MKNILNDTCYLIWICILLHLIADYTLQGCLADLKQKQWWRNQIDMHRGETYEWHQKAWKKYKHDYIAGLLCHAAMWTLVTFFPLMFVTDSVTFSFIAISNIALHTAIDHMKANMHCINLCQDQLFHLIEVITTVLIAQN